MKTCAFHTLGCKVNQYETQSIRESFVTAGYRELEFSKPCDVYVINTCTVTAKTDKESRRFIREARRRNPQAKVVVTGCYVELNEGEIEGIPGSHIIVKNCNKHKIPDILDYKEDPPQETAHKAEYPALAISNFKDRTKAFLKVQDGCDKFCAYCKVPMVRGRSRSRDIESAVTEARRLTAKGFKEIVLTGICLGAWGEELSPQRGLSELLKRLIKLEGDFRIRLSSIEPKYVDERLLSIMEESSRICRHLHIPFQSGDNKILKMMNRPYTARVYSDIAEMARRYMPDMSITTDILVGFPGETEVNFRNTHKFVKKIRPSRVHIFTYSKRDGTTASRMGGEVPKDITKMRLNKIKDLASRLSYGYRKKFLQKETKVLIEGQRDKATGLLTGYDDKYIKILLKGDSRKGGIMPVRIQKVEPERTFGAIL